MKKDLSVKTFKFSVQAAQWCRALEKSPGIPRLFSRQLFRAGASIGANTEEGQGAQRQAAREPFYWILLRQAGNGANRTAGITAGISTHPIRRICSVRRFPLPRSPLPLFTSPF